MSARDAFAVGGADDVLMRVGRWLLAKVWLGCLLSGGYAAGRHFGWPQALLTVVALAGAVALAVVVAWLPAWTRDRPTGTPVDVGLRAVVWAGLAAGVCALLIGAPAVGMVAGALLLSTAWHTFHRRPRQTRPPVRRAADHSLLRPAADHSPLRPAADHSPLRRGAGRHRLPRSGYRPAFGRAPNG
jgi:hypothetical protein